MSVFITVISGHDKPQPPGCLLDRIAANRGYPVMLRMDNGPEFISLALAEWVSVN
ncbi:hypothetical protein FSG91_022920 [Escherichia coli]|uniref:hypothetical protein n=1 Tax=Escherichia coli TaxID=562 RepID=UPI0015620DA8|nr:hypothetical protein [Escherichia coli]MBB2216042.1 hypothetical protein [Escherichia coli]